MAEDHKEPNYVAVFGWLFVLTVLEILAAIAPISKTAKVILLVVMALGKAGLVAMYFMHLRFEKKTMGAIVFTPLVLCVFLMVMLFPDLLTVDHQTSKTWGVEQLADSDDAGDDEDDDEDEDEDDEDEDDEDEDED